MVVSASDIGRIREQNEDAFLADPERGLFIVSDGLGGHQAGDVASKAVVQVLPMMLMQRLTSLGKLDARKIRRSLSCAVNELSHGLRRESAGQLGLSGMGATVVAALIRKRWAYIVHMGDSRAYRLRAGQLERLTEDHTVVGLLLRSGEITPEEAETHPARGQLTRFVGMDDDVPPDTRTVHLKKGDRLLLCTDGLTDMLNDGEIAELLMTHQDPNAACHALIDTANNAGGRDNITVIVIDWSLLDLAARARNP
jgi:serine/threonine protein phosphatase PrpC